MYKLPDEHLQKAIEIAQNNRIKKNCKVCYDRGYIGTTEENLLVICHKCVDLDKSMEDWKKYIKTVPELMEHFQSLFEEDNKENQE